MKIPMEKRYDHKTQDQIARALWHKEQVYTTYSADKKQYTIDTPPPTVSGSLHIGHIFSYTQTDILARYKRMTGHNVFYPFGFDCNGLPTERFVEKKYDTNVSKIGRQAFIDLCVQATKEKEVEFIELWKTMAISAHFETSYSTISKTVQKLSQASFMKLLQKEYVYLKNEPALFCTTCQTSVAQAELDDKELPSTFNDIVFTAQDGTNLVIGTTRPELLPSCVALLYHKDDARYQHLAGTMAMVPLFGFSVPVLADETVQQDKGTGLVMCCTFGDKTDIAWFKKFNFAYKPSFNHFGKWLDSTGPLAGLKAQQARAKVLELLSEQGLLVNQKQIMHAVNVHERCKSEIEYMQLPQWFVKIVDYKDTFIKLADEITWSPYHMKYRYIDWVKNLHWDWCISRQRVYGIPFPVWYCNDCSAILVADEAQLPVDPQQTTYKNGLCDQCNSSNIRPEKDVMDTWNTSSITPYIVKELMTGASDVFENNVDGFLPMSMRPQAHDIIRTWAFYTIIKSWMHDNVIPWKEIVISGFVLSAQKEKISKSVGNAPTEPVALLAMFEPDAIRYWTASGTLGQDVAFSPDQMKIGQKLMNKLWNAFKFADEHLANFEPGTNPVVRDTVNGWILEQAHATLQQYHDYLEKNEFGLALQAAEKFFWAEFCDNYIEIIKDQFFAPQAYSKEQIYATQATLYEVGLMILQMYAPYLPYVTESLYQTVFAAKHGVKSLHATQFGACTPTTQFFKDMAILLEFIGAVRAVKTKYQLSLRTPVAVLTVACSAHAQQLLRDHAVLLAGMLKIETMKFETVQTTDLVQDDETWSGTLVMEQ